jgi:hypothetical protein
MRLVLLSLLLCLSATSHAAGPDAATVAGDYRLQGVREVGSLLRLSADGRYQFMAAVGSVDETDEGRWTVDNDAVVLKSSAPRQPPVVKFRESAKDDKPGVRVQFAGPDGKRAAGALHVELTANGARRGAYSGPERGLTESPRAELPVQRISIMLLGFLRKYPPTEFQPPNPEHNHYVFEVTLGNYGRTVFDDLRLRIQGDDLVMPVPPQREFLYARIKPG